MCQTARRPQLVARDPAGFPTLNRVGRIAVEFEHQGVLVENGEPEKAAEEARKKLLDIWAKYKDSCAATVPVTGGPTGAAAPEEPARGHPTARRDPPDPSGPRSGRARGAPRTGPSTTCRPRPRQETGSFAPAGRRRRTPAIRTTSTLSRGQPASPDSGEPGADEPGTPAVSPWDSRGRTGWLREPGDHQHAVMRPPGDHRTRGIHT